MIVAMVQASRANGEAVVTVKMGIVDSCIDAGYPSVDVRLAQCWLMSRRSVLLVYLADKTSSGRRPHAGMDMM